LEYGTLKRIADCLGPTESQHAPAPLVDVQFNRLAFGDHRLQTRTEYLRPPDFRLGHDYFRFLCRQLNGYRTQWLVGGDGNLPGRIGSLIQFIGGINDLEIELESFVGLHKLGQLVEGQEDAVHNDATVGNSPPKPVVREGPCAIPLHKMPNGKQLGDSLP
jgi:hypothetical protein